MLSFWARYVLLKEESGTPRETTLEAIETKYGATKRQEIETELNDYQAPTT
jgi:hypothetical protein